MKDEIKELKRLVELIKNDTAIDNHYKTGMINGFEWAISVLEKRPANFISVNDLEENG